MGRPSGPNSSLFFPTVVPGGTMIGCPVLGSVSCLPSLVSIGTSLLVVVDPGWRTGVSGAEVSFFPVPGPADVAPDVTDGVPEPFPPASASGPVLGPAPGPSPVPGPSP